MSNIERLLKNYRANSKIYSQLHEMGIKEFTDIQYYAIIWNLFQGSNLLVSPATSGGKTLVGEMACVNAILNHKKKCLYLVPLRSLANEKFIDFRKHWKSLEIRVEMSTGDMTLLDREAEEEKLKNVDLLITTYERGDSILRSSPEWFNDVQVIVVDEIHNLGSNNRGPRLEGFILRLKLRFQKIQFIYLSATLSNTDDFASWLGGTLIEHSHRPVPLSYQIKLINHLPDRNEGVKEIVRDTLKEGGSLLVFTPTRYEAEELCREISDFIADEELLYLINGQELRATVKQFKDKILSRFDQRLFFSIQHSVAFHHAGLSRDLKGFIESLFRKGLLKVISCTPTLSSGVNLPAKTVVIKDVGVSRPYLSLDPNTLHQMCGRAGRPGYDEQGRAVILAANLGEKADIEVIYFTSHKLIPKLAPIESQFMESENVLEQYLAWIVESVHGLKERDLNELTSKTFWYFTQKRRQPDITLDYLTRIGHYSLQNLLIRNSSPEVFREAANIPNSAVQIRQRDDHKLEAVLRDGLYIKTSFTKDGYFCGCGVSGKLCRHLVKLAQLIYQENPSYARDIILSALHEEQLVDRLLKYRMIKILNGRLQATNFGKLVYQLYIQPTTAFWIHMHLPTIKTWENFIDGLMYVYNKERKHRIKVEYRGALNHLLEESHVDLNYSMHKTGDAFKIYPGDMEEFVEAIRWVAHCFASIADLEGFSIVRDFSERVLDRLNSSEPPQEKSS